MPDKPTTREQVQQAWDAAHPPGTKVTCLCGPQCMAECGCLCHRITQAYMDRVTSGEIDGIGPGGKIITAPPPKPPTPADIESGTSRAYRKMVIQRAKEIKTATGVSQDEAWRRARAELKKSPRRRPE